MSEEFYFVGKDGQTSHDDLKDYRVGGYPVFLTFNKSNPNERHYMARFCHYEDAVMYADIKNKALANESNKG